MNWVRATGDAYAAQRMAATLNMCPNFVAESKFNHVSAYLC